MDKIIDGKRLAEKREKKLRKKLGGLASKPRVVSILVGDDPSSLLYTELKRKKAQELDIDFRPMHFPAQSPFSNVAQAVSHLNQDKEITGIMVQLPLPEKFLGSRQSRELLELIDPQKDVDGLTANTPFLPAAVKAVISILEEEGVEVRGKRAVVLGESDLVGKPLAKELRSRGAQVTICNKQTPNISELTKQAQLIISATGVPKLLTGEMVSEGVVVIDVGAEKVDEKVVGDVDFESVASKASKITPVPGGVGPVTVISLMENVVEAALSSNQVQNKI